MSNLKILRCENLKIEEFLAKKPKAFNKQPNDHNDYE